ncbi:hypothetical protein [Brasilonema sp. UFV-L1]|uniref:hypothetical protein n=1 Tax=Brasilonema sp. UFV-L1 TaxID=2234130 RepID=UPI00145CECBD|nr:hypothetical protein [Brasilonema sp. UFV-L1]NMG11905.1 hypothetical protein [Brasilonema sp. UFV-L1]
MFTRIELETKSLLELVALCNRYGLKAYSDPNLRSSWATVLLSFSNIALSQMQQGVGLKHPGRDAIESLIVAYDAFGLPTREQSALIKVSVEERRIMPLPYRIEQQRILALYQAKLNLDKAISLLSSF